MLREWQKDHSNYGSKSSSEDMNPELQNILRISSNTLELGAWNHLVLHLDKKLEDLRIEEVPLDAHNLEIKMLDDVWSVNKFLFVNDFQVKSEELDTSYNNALVLSENHSSPFCLGERACSW